MIHIIIFMFNIIEILQSIHYVMHFRKLGKNIKTPRYPTTYFLEQSR